MKFLAERYAEEWSAARDLELLAGLDTSRATRDVDVKREILGLCVTETEATGGRPLAIRVVLLLASAYDETGEQLQAATSRLGP